MTERLEAQFAFLNEADRLKHVMRATTLVDGTRPENSGEHSWHLALYALVLADQAGPGVNIDRVIRMLLIHDLVEIDVGDVPIHSQNGQAHASAETQAANPARRIAFSACFPMICATLFARFGRSSRPPKPPTPALPSRWTACSR